MGLRGTRRAGAGQTQRAARPAQCSQAPCHQACMSQQRRGLRKAKRRAHAPRAGPAAVGARDGGAPRRRGAAPGGRPRAAGRGRAARVHRARQAARPLLPGGAHGRAARPRVAVQRPEPALRAWTLVMPQGCCMSLAGMHNCLGCRLPWMRSVASRRSCACWRRLAAVWHGGWCPQSALLCACWWSSRMSKRIYCRAPARADSRALPGARRVRGGGVRGDARGRGRGADAAQLHHRAHAAVHPAPEPGARAAALCGQRRTGAL